MNKDSARHARRVRPPVADPVGRWNTGRDLLAAVLLLVALLLPWNLLTGMGIPNGYGPAYYVPGGVTLLSLTSVAVASPMARRARARGRDGTVADRLRLWLNVPYFLTVFAVAALATVQTVRYGGTWNAPAGFGPGAWFGVAGAVLAAQPAMTATAADVYRFNGWRTAARIVGRVAVIVAGLAAVFMVYWRARQVIGAGGGVAVDLLLVVGTIVYAAAVLTVVVLGCRWIGQDDRAARLALGALGTTTLLSGLLVWCTGVGRDVDAFHGIAQNSSAAGVGFEAYLAWVIAAAIVAPLTVHGMVSPAFDSRPLAGAARKVLALIAAWSIGASVARAIDFASVVVFDLHDPAWKIGVTGVVSATAAWLALRLRTTPRRATAVALALVMIVRLALNVALAPRIPAAQHFDVASRPVYGNTLAHQLTSTFDVVVCLLAVFVAAATFVRATAPATQATPSLQPTATGPERLADAGAVASTVAPRIDRGLNAPAPASAPASSSAPVWVAKPVAAPIITRGASKPTDAQADSALTADDPAAGPKTTPEASELLRESTDRFGAGTTYG